MKLASCLLEKKGHSWGNLQDLHRVEGLSKGSIKGLEKCLSYTCSRVEIIENSPDRNWSKFIIKELRHNRCSSLGNIALVQSLRKWHRILSVCGLLAGFSTVKLSLELFILHTVSLPIRVGFFG